ncbi:MAG: hypothetical protein ACO2PM_14710 [Pyrobaculum sp.]|jgi:hypothetical protein
MKAEAAVGGNCAEAVERISGGSRGISLRDNRLIVWMERGGRREAVLDVVLDKHNAELVYEALKRVEDSAQFGRLFDVLTNAEMCVGVDGRVHFCDEGFDYVVSGHE